MGISLKNVSYSYRGKYQTVRAVDGVSYDFEPGKLYAIIGKSGSGKTTLMSLRRGRFSWTASPQESGTETPSGGMGCR